MIVTSEMIDAGVLAWLRAGGPECDGVGLVGSIYKAMREVDPAFQALSGLADDYMTSETHHPGYVLIPTAKFEKLVGRGEA